VISTAKKKVCCYQR